MADVQIEWGILTDGQVWPVPKYVADAIDPQHLGPFLVDAKGGEVVCRTTTITDWTCLSLVAQAWAKIDNVPADRKFVVAVKALRAEISWTLLETVTALDAYLANVGLSRTGGAL